MTDLIVAFKDLILDNFTQIWRLFVVPFTSLGAVYIMGRLIPILKTDNSKNLLALVCMIGVSYFTGLSITSNLTIDYVIADVVLYTTLSSIVYVTICWKLYERIDNFLDEKLGKNKEKKKPIKKKKKISPLKAIKK